ncbi:MULTISPECIES: hypothetical protein [unclassified Novosphingobium]|uniref:hypothetical protein n=1 Tax=unclassified Novosphingobium TaxID=2644732 RepID=UPI001F1DD678|nr:MULTISPECIES: hypothetical protein [unclassified Novosphingobium]
MPDIYGHERAAISSGCRAAAAPPVLLSLLLEYDSLPASLIAGHRIVSGPLDEAANKSRGVSVMRVSTVRKGLFRTNLPGLGECARVDMSAGDAAPYLEREMYVLLGFQPSFEQLPEKQPDAKPASRRLWSEWN